jgi:hypothetical protein
LTIKQVYLSRSTSNCTLEVVFGMNVIKSASHPHSWCFGRELHGNYNPPQQTYSKGRALCLLLAVIVVLYKPRVVKNFESKEH